MTRPAVRTPARYGLPNSERVRSDLAVLGLFSDLGPEPGSEGVLTAVSRAGRPEHLPKGRVPGLTCPLA